MIAMASDKKKEFKYHKILALDGCYIFRQMHTANGIAPLTALKDGKLDTSRFEGVLDESLETEKLAAVYKKHAKNSTETAQKLRISYHSARNHVHGKDFPCKRPENVPATGFTGVFSTR